MTASMRPYTGVRRALSPMTSDLIPAEERRVPALPERMLGPDES